MRLTIPALRSAGRNAAKRPWPFSNGDPSAQTKSCKHRSLAQSQEQAATQLADYFAGVRQHFDVPLDMRGTAFQQRVWAALLAIPFGETRSYGAIASAIGQPTASRAVGAANGRNPLSILAPCHRVVGNGALTGFAGGLAAKTWLLDHERQVLGT